MVNLSLKVVIVKNYYALKLIENFIFDNNVKKLTENCELQLQQPFFFFDAQFDYCPLIWMLHSRQNNKNIKNLYERWKMLVTY